MLPIEHQIYVAGARGKPGELLGLQSLAPDVADRILPHIVFPPPREKDLEKRRLLTDDELVYENAARVGRHWPHRPVLLDTRFLGSRLGEAESCVWLPTLFREVRASNGRAIPVVTLQDLEGSRLAGMRGVILEGESGAALRLTLSDLDHEGAKTRIQRAVMAAVLKPSECILLLDLTNDTLEDVDAVVDVATARFWQLVEIGAWRRIVLQATSYPEHNPAAPGKTKILDRKEWDVWERLTNEDALIKRTLMFGDFGADCAKFSFKPSNARPIPHHRYATTRQWIVVRGKEEGSLARVMQEVAERVVSQALFDGPDFSAADRYLFDASEGHNVSGSATAWRKVNTNRHLTKTVAALGDVFGFGVSSLRQRARAEQLKLV
jgi:hypothetical protein